MIELVPFCECGCGASPNTGKRFVRGHQVKLMQQRNREREYSREHMEKLWAAVRGKPSPFKRPRFMVPCACGCGAAVESPDRRGRPRAYINGHQTKTLVLKRKLPYGPSPNKGKKATDETRRKLRDSHKGLPAHNKGKKSDKPAWNKGKPGKPVPLDIRLRISSKLKGSQSHLWRGGSDDAARYARLQAVEWKILRKQMYKRDGWKCVLCAKVGPIQCHHILPVRHGGTDDPSNLATLCPSCHKRQDNLFGTERYHWHQPNQNSPTHE
jgi:hypothetical protein